MIQKLTTNGFVCEKKVSEFCQRYEKIYQLVSYLLEIDVEYLKVQNNKHNELSFLVERVKIGKEEKLVQNLKEKKTNTELIKYTD